MHYSLGVSIIVIVPVVLFALVTGTLVWISDHRSRQNQLFLADIAVATIWSVLSLLSFANNNEQITRITSNLASASSFTLLLTSFIFTQFFFYGNLSAWIRRGLLPLSIPLVVLFTSNYTCGTINQNSNCTGGPAYGYMITLIVILFVLILRNCVIGMRSSSELVAQQARIMLYGFLLSITTGIVFAYLLPQLNITNFNAVYPLTPIIFIGFIFYAIVRHKLFDVRAVVAQTLGYLISVLVLASVYGFIVFGSARLLFGLHISWPLLIFLSATTGISGLLFQRLRRVFDRTTNRVFYHDAYDTQELFDQLNKVLVSSLNLSYLLKQVSRVIALNIKSGFCYFAVREGGPQSYTFDGTIRPHFDNQEMSRLRSLVGEVHRPVIVADDLDESKSELKHLLDKNDIAVIVRITQNPNKPDQGLGYMMLGQKKSGNPYNGQDIRVLDTIAKELIIAIQNSLHFEEIQNFNVTLQSRVERATSQLRRTNQKLQELDETKDDFISMASHQLRTPLTSVKGYISMVMEGDAGAVTETQANMLRQAFVSSQRMVFLIADLLNVSRLKTGKFVIEPVPTDLARVVREEVDQLRETAEVRSITMSYDTPTDLPLLMLDDTKIRQVVMNFIDNAIYYTPSGGHINIELHNKPKSVELKVVDDGIGVPKNVQHNLFNKFYRAPNAQKARPDGTGLGLFMAKKIIIAQGGALLFSSREGKGSTFGFTFPKSKQAPKTTAPVVAAETAA